VLRNEVVRNGMNVDRTTRRGRGHSLREGMLRNGFSRNGMNVDYTARRRRADLLRSKACCATKSSAME
jgi:hypothetical protein